MCDLFESIAPPEPSKVVMAEGAVLLRGAALPVETELLAALTTSPRHLRSGIWSPRAATRCPLP